MCYPCAKHAGPAETRRPKDICNVSQAGAGMMSSTSSNLDWVELAIR